MVGVYDAANAIGHLRLAFGLSDQGKYEEAEEVHRQVLSGCRRRCWMLSLHPH